MDALNRDMSDGNLDLDQRMSLVVGISGQGLAFCAEIGIVTDRAFVAIPLDVCLVWFGGTDWSIAINATVLRLPAGDVSKRLVDGCEAVAWVGLRCRGLACGAVVPVRTGQTLVAQANNLLQSVSIVGVSM